MHNYQVFATFSPHFDCLILTIYLGCKVFVEFGYFSVGSLIASSYDGGASLNDVEGPGPGPGLVKPPLAGIGCARGYLVIQKKGKIQILIFNIVF